MPYVDESPPQERIVIRRRAIPILSRRCSGLTTESKSEANAVSLQASASCRWLEPRIELSVAMRVVPTENNWTSTRMSGAAIVLPDTERGHRCGFVRVNFQSQVHPEMLACEAKHARLPLLLGGHRWLPLEVRIGANTLARTKASWPYSVDS